MLDVVVIGAGISGLSAALLLSEQGLAVRVLEARDRVGGRTYTVRDPKYGGYTDLGGAYIGQMQPRVLRMCRRFGLELYKISVEQRTILNYKGKNTLYTGTLPPVYNPLEAMDANNIQQKLDQMAKLVPPEAPWKAPDAASLDSMTLKEFVDANCWTEFGRTSTAIVCRAILCAEMHEVSLLAFLWYLSAGHGFQNLTNVTNGAQERKFVGGAQQLSESMAKVLDDHVQLSSPVVRVEQGKDSVTVWTAGNEKFEAKFVISAVPQAILNRITFVPSLPAKKLQLIQRIPMGSIIKTMTFYEKPYWREKDLSGQMATDAGPVLYCVDDTKPDGSAPCLMGFILADRARDMTLMTPDQRKQALAAHYADKFQCPQLLNPVNYAEKNWSEEEYSGGCYVSNFPPGVLTKFGEELRRPVDKVYFAGTESATYWVGYMEGAIQAGERAASEILYTLGRIPAFEIWKDEPPASEWPEIPWEPALVERILPSVPTFLFGLGSILVGVAAWMAHRAYNLG